LDFPIIAGDLFSALVHSPIEKSHDVEAVGDHYRVWKCFANEGTKRLAHVERYNFDPFFSERPGEACTKCIEIFAIDQVEDLFADMVHDDSGKFGGLVLWLSDEMLVEAYNFRQRMSPRLGPVFELLLESCVDQPRTTAKLFFDFLERSG